MRNLKITVAFIVSLIVSMPSFALDEKETLARRRAMELYSDGMYENARKLFETLPDDPLSQGYVVLCAVRMKSRDCVYLLKRYFKTNASSIISNEICYRYAINLFDSSDYPAASSWFGKVKASSLASSERVAFAFRKGYCAFNSGAYPEARKNFNEVEQMEMSVYKSPSRYCMGYMAYMDRNFKEAAEWFELSSSDPGFADLSRFYLVDCHFMMKDYDYVISRGVALYESASEPRQKHLARIISESCLVRGDRKTAREFFELSSLEQMTRSDYFYAGSVLYAVDDFRGAIENYEKVTDRSDSLGQIANYHLGYSYIRTRNKVAAMGAFKAASEVSFNAEMQEDAWFNYAKLAFDVNKDTHGFMSYMERYSTSCKGDMIYGYMALAMLTDRDYAGAVDAYDHIDDLDADQHSNYIKAYFLRASQLVSGGAYSDAIPYFKAAAYYLPKQNRLNQLARYWQGECCFKTGKYSEAAALYADLYNLSALPSQSEGSLLTYNAAYSYFMAGDYASASRWFDLYLTEKTQTYRGDALLRRADCDFALKLYAEAVVSYGRAIDEGDLGKDLYPVYQQGLSYGLAGKKKDKVSALAAAERVSSEARFYSQTMYELGRSYMDIKKNDRAIATFEKLSAEASDDATRARALIGLGMVYRNIRNYDKSLESYKEVVSSMPGTEYAADALLAIESIYQTRKQPQKYIEYVEQNRLASEKSDAAKEEMYFNAVEQSYMSSDWNQTLSCARQYIDAYPEGSRRTDATFYMAEAYNGLGNREKAAECFKNVNEGSFAESAAMSYADICFGMERYLDAYDAYTHLLSITLFEANKTRALTGMVRSAYRSRRYEDAISTVARLREKEIQDEDLLREMTYIEAKSCMATSLREKGIELFRELAAHPATPQGAEARYMLVQDAFDKGEFETVQNLVFDFSDKSGDQSYWLARAYIVLADSFLETGNKAQARATYESVKDGYEPSGQEDDIVNIINARLSKLETL